MGKFRCLYEMPSVDELWENLRKNGGSEALSTVKSLRSLNIGDKYKVLNTNKVFVKVDMRKLYDKKTVYGCYGMDIETKEVVYFDSYTQVEKLDF